MVGKEGVTVETLDDDQDGVHALIEPLLCCRNLINLARNKVELQLWKIVLVVVLDELMKV